MEEHNKKEKVKSANNTPLSKIKLKSADEVSEFAENIINTVREPLLVLDKELRVVKASRSFFDFFKVSSDETIGTLIYDLGNQQWNIPKLRELLETILPEKTTFDNYEVEHNFSTIGKRIMLLNARQIERAFGKEKIILLAIEDITERKKIEDGLEKTRKELVVIKKSADEISEFAENIINTVREPLLLLDKELRVVKASRSFFDFFKVSSDETIGTLIYNLGNQQWDIPKLRELLETILPEKTTFDNYEVEHNFSTIGKRIMLLNARQIERAFGKEKIILLAIEDITDRKKTEGTLKKAKEMAESADRLKSSFLATMSHELRTPLNSIIGFTGILLNELPGSLNEEQSKQLNMIKGSGQHLLELINDVLDISKIEAGELVVSLKPFNFSKSINKVVSIVKLLADKKGLELRSNISQDIKDIISDERRVEQVFLNILNNAIKFTEQGFIEINCEIQNDQIITRITDTGIGIKKEDMDKLFRPFSQIEMGITRTRYGTGLGLSICKKLLGKLNGTISVESQFRVGSVFTVTLPIN